MVRIVPQKQDSPLLDAEINRILRDDVRAWEQIKKAGYLAAIADLLRTIHGADDVVDRDT
jgi:hypothetical protein